MNYIIVEPLKLVVKTSVEDIDDIEEELIDEIIVGDNIEVEDVDDIGDVETNKLNLKEGYELYRCYKLIQSINGLDIDKLFLYFLINKAIDYDILDDIDEKEYENNGYYIISEDLEEDYD